jgi:hydroxymethylbilane synthase
MPQVRIFRIGTRASKLARWQSDWVAAQLMANGVSVEIVEISTAGDVQQQGPVTTIGAQGVFTKEIQSALLADEVDVAVHSLKDLPTQEVEGLTLAAVPTRANPTDALVATNAASFRELRPGARVGTGSLRRRAQLLALRPDLNVLAIRGNVDTRLRKLDAGEYDAIILAAAGLSRLGWGDRISELLQPPRMLPAPGQGALGIECRAGHAETLAVLARLDDAATRSSVVAERAMLAALHGGCAAPVAAWGRVEGDSLVLDGLVAELDGKFVLRASASAPVDQPPETLGHCVAEKLIQQGAAELVAAARPM